MKLANQEKPKAQHFSTGHTVDLEKGKLARVFILKPALPTATTEQTMRSSQAITPWWFVKQVAAPAETNMKYTLVKVDGCLLSVMTNSRALKQWEPLSVLEHKSEEAEVPAAKRPRR